MSGAPSSEVLKTQGLVQIGRILSSHLEVNIIFDRLYSQGWFSTTTPMRLVAWTIISLQLWFATSGSFEYCSITLTAMYLIHPVFANYSTSHPEQRPLEQKSL